MGATLSLLHTSTAKDFNLGGKNLWTHKTLKNSHYFIFFSDCTVYIKYFIQYSE